MLKILICLHNLNEYPNLNYNCKDSYLPQTKIYKYIELESLEHP